MLQNLLDVALDLGAALALAALYLAAYTAATAHNEFALIRKNVPAAAISLGFSLIGFSIPLSSAMIYASTFLDLALYGLVALAVQILVYGLVRLVLPDLSPRIARGEIAPAVFLGAASMAAGLVTASALRF